MATREGGACGLCVDFCYAHDYGIIAVMLVPLASCGTDIANVSFMRLYSIYNILTIQTRNDDFRIFFRKSNFIWV